MSDSGTFLEGRAAAAMTGSAAMPDRLPPYLTQDEIDDICDPLTSAAAQIRYLLREGLLVTRKPNGRALVMRSELERVKGAARLASAAKAQNAIAGPNVVGLDQWAMKRKHGTQTQGR